MADVSVPRGASERLGRVEGRLDVANGATVRVADGNLVVVTGEARFGGNATVDCDLECERLTVERSGKLVVSGSLTVHTELDVSNAIDVGGILKAEDVDVGGRVQRTIGLLQEDEGGRRRQGIGIAPGRAGRGRGKIEARGTLDVKELRVGGKAEIGGGAITGTINVGGKFESSSRLDFGELQVFGMCSLAAGSKGRKIAASGKLRADGDLECDEIEIAGVATVSGSCRAVHVEVRKGSCNVARSLSISGGWTYSGPAEVGGASDGESLRVSGKFSAEKAILTKDAETIGSVDTQKGLKARSVRSRTGTRCTGPIVGESVEVGVSGPGRQRLLSGGSGSGYRPRTRAGWRTLRLQGRHRRRFEGGAQFRGDGRTGSGCDVDEVTYIGELKVADHVTIAHPVRKVDGPKEPPL